MCIRDRLDVMMEQDIIFDGAVGVSAGAVFGCNYKSRQPGRVIRYNKRYCRDPRYVSIRSLLKTGDLYGESFCYHELPDRLDPFDAAAYRKNPMEFYVVCTDALTGEAVYHRCDRGDARDLQWMRASASMPMVSKLVELDVYKRQHILPSGEYRSAPFVPKGFFRLPLPRCIFQMLLCVNTSILFNTAAL